MVLAVAPKRILLESSQYFWQCKRQSTNETTTTTTTTTGNDHGGMNAALVWLDLSISSLFPFLLISEWSILHKGASYPQKWTSSCFYARDDKMCRKQVWKKWLPADTWISVLTMSGLIDDNVFTIDTQHFNRSLSQSKDKLDGPSMDIFDEGSLSGVFRVKFIKRFYNMMLTDPTVTRHQYIHLWRAGNGKIASILWLNMCWCSWRWNFQVC
jgi:hypothetical protein